MYNSKRFQRFESTQPRHPSTAHQSSRSCTRVAIECSCTTIIECMVNVEVFCHGRLIGFISAGKACQTGHVSETIPASSVQTTTYDISTTSLRVCWSVGSVAISTLQPCQVKTYTSQCETEAASTHTRIKRNYPHIITYRQQRWHIPQSFDSSVTPSAQESSLIRIFQRRQFSAAAGLFSLVLHARGN